MSRLEAILDRFDSLCGIGFVGYQRHHIRPASRDRGAAKAVRILPRQAADLQSHFLRKGARTLPYFNIVAETSENTVVTEYEPVKARSESYQSEAALEKEFIRLLCEQGYEYLPIHTEADLVANLRAQLEKLNDYRFTDAEWERFFKNSLSNQNEGITEKTRRIQEDNVQVLKRDDGTSKNITLIDKRNVHATSCRSSISTRSAPKKAPGTTTATM
jgi:hypothetical protein